MSRHSDFEYYQIRKFTLSCVRRWKLDTPKKRRANESLSYYIKSLFTWHDETLNCWTNILSILVTVYATLQCASLWALYVGCMAITTNICSLIAHLFINVDYRTECIVFALDLFGVMVLGSLTSMSYVAYAFLEATSNMTGGGSFVPMTSYFDNRTNFVTFTLISQKILGIFLLLISIKRYQRGCLDRWKRQKEEERESVNKKRTREDKKGGCREWKCEHTDVVQSVSHCFPVAAAISIPTAIYTQCIHQLAFFIIFLGTTRMLLGASNLWLDRRWLLHAISHITGALSVGVAVVHLAENSSQSTHENFLASPTHHPFSSLSLSPILIFIWCDFIMLALIVITVLQLYKHIC